MKYEKLSKKAISCMFVATLVQFLISTSILFLIWFIFIERSIVPIERLHKIAIEKGPIDRMFKLAKVIVTTAGGDVVIRFLEDEKSEFIAYALKKKINEMAIKSRLEKQESLL